MRSCLVGVSALLIAMSSNAWAGSDQDGIGFPPYAFAQSWTSLPSGHFQPVSPTSAPVRVHAPRAMAVDDGRMQHVLDAALSSAGDDQNRREIALNEMTTPWPQPQRWAFQRVRDAQAAYAAGDEQRTARFAALASRVADGTGRSAAVDGSAPATLDTAFAAALSQQDDGTRAKTEAAEKSFVAYREAFAAFADARSPGTGAGVVAELDRQRAADLGADKN
jgi:hypothetical protein